MERLLKTASLLPVETVSLQGDGTAPNSASPGWGVGAAGSSAVSPGAPSVVASLTAHVQSSQLIGLRMLLIIKVMGQQLDTFHYSSVSWGDFMMCISYRCPMPRK